MLFRFNITLRYITVKIIIILKFTYLHCLVGRIVHRTVSEATVVSVAAVDARSPVGDRTRHPVS